VAGTVGHAQGNHHPSIAPYGLFRCAGGSVQLSCGSESLWRKLCAAFGLDPEAPGLATNGERVGNRQQVIDLLESTFAEISPEDLLARLAAAGVPAGKVRTLDEVYGWDQTLSQGLLIDVEHATLGRVSLPGPPLRFFAPGPDGEVETTRTRHAAPPVLGADGDALRAEFAAPTDDLEDGPAT
jgi:formyl-CoA transferase